MPKPSGFTRRVQLEKELARDEARRFAVRQAKDMMLIAANEAFGFGPERLKRLSDAYDAAFIEYANLTIDDAKFDKSIEYTKGVVDRKLKEICGPYFDPWEERYK